jgi:hypothetical protein
MLQGLVKGRLLLLPSILRNYGYGILDTVAIYKVFLGQHMGIYVVILGIHLAISGQGDFSCFLQY